MLQHLSRGRMDLMLGRGSIPLVYPWFGQDIRQSLPLALENYSCCTGCGARTSWTGRGSTAPRCRASPRSRGPWTTCRRSCGTARSAPRNTLTARDDGDGFFANNIFWPKEHYMRLIRFYRQRYAHYGHGTREAGHRRPGRPGLHRQELAGRQAGVPALLQRGAGLRARPVRWRNSSDLTPLSVGSPQEVIDKTLTFREHFGDYQRQLFLMDHAGLPLKTVLDQLDLLGEEVVPVLRKEIAARQDPETPEAPTHASLVRAKYGDQPAAPAAPERQPRRQHRGRVPLPGHATPRAGRVPDCDAGRRASPTTRGRRCCPPTPCSMKQFAAEDIWADVSMREYDVLYTLSKCRGPHQHERAEPSRPAQPRPCPAWWTGWPSAAWSSAAPTPPTGAASGCRSPQAGRALQRQVGRQHARGVARAMTAGLDPGELRQLETICLKLAGRHRTRTHDP